MKLWPKSNYNCEYISYQERDKSQWEAMIRYPYRGRGVRHWKRDKFLKNDFFYLCRAIKSCERSPKTIGIICHTWKYDQACNFGNAQKS